MSERLRVQDPEFHDKWYSEMQSTGIETPVPKTNKSSAEIHAQFIRHVLRRAAAYNVDLDVSQPRN